MTLDLFKHELVMDVATDSSGNLKEFERPRDTVVVNKGGFWSRIHGGNFSINATESEALALGDVTSPARGLYLEVSGDCDITLNGAVPLQVRRTAGEINAQQAAKVFLEAGITSLEITNVSATEAITGTYRVWGDEIP